ncbi:MAG: zinc ribbon domain-containing protein [Thermoleophilaceae bacterium]|nr:zinc ribbon domain-containing protein [Thermoleophilaceae bacterium]
MTPCPRCGEPAEPGQLVCLECGNRIALKEEGSDRRSFENLPAVALLLCVVVIGAGAFGFALSELTSDSNNDSAAADRPEQPAPATEAPQTDTDTGASQQASQSLLLEWPKDLTAYTVVLVTTGDRPAARRVARKAAKTGLEAGLLRSDDFDLGTNLWIVFAGRFDTRASAESQAGNLGGRYPGAYATLVKPAG